MIIFYFLFNTMFCVMNNQKDCIPVDSSRNYELFNQTLDHFNSLNTVHLKQRYLLNDEYYNGSHILIVYIGGQSCLRQNTVDDESGYPVYLAKKYGATLAALEHRFYGQSLPNHGVCNTRCYHIFEIKFLTSEQALDDLSSFIKSLKADKSKDYRRVIVIGEGYAGTLAAWMRSLYPHLVDGALSSSAPIEFVEDFVDFDNVIEQGLNDTECAKNIRSAIKQIDKDIDTDFTKVKVLVNCEENMTMDDPNDLRLAFANAIAYAVQYNREDGGGGGDQGRGGGNRGEGGEKWQMRKNLCKIMNQHIDTTAPLNFYKFFNGLLQNMSTNCSSFADRRETLNISNEHENTSMRQYYWQACTELGLFPTGTTESLRSSRLDLAYFRGLCNASFGNGTGNSPVVPDVIGTNKKYRGRDLIGTNIDFTNGEYDPYRLLSIYPTDASSSFSNSRSSSSSISFTSSSSSSFSSSFFSSPASSSPYHYSTTNTTEVKKKKKNGSGLVEESKREGEEKEEEREGEEGEGEGRDVDEQAARQHWGCYVINGSGGGSDLQYPGAGMGSSGDAVAAVQHMVDEDIQRWLGYLIYPPWYWSTEYIDPLSQYTFRDKMVTFGSPFFIISAVVLAISLVVLIVALCCASEYNQRASKIQYERRFGTDPRQRLINRKN